MKYLTRLLLYLGLFALAACSADRLPPRPYAVMPRETSLLNAIVNQPGVEITPPHGVSPEQGMSLAKALAVALQEEDIPAVVGQTLTGAHRLMGTARLETGAIILSWTLHDPMGAELGTVQARDAVSKQAGADEPLPDTVVQALTAQVAPGLAQRLQPPKGAQGENLRVFVPDIAGLPGDGGKSLPLALRRALNVAGMSLAEKDDPKAIRIVGQVVVSDLDAANQLVKLNWRVLRPDGVEIGAVDQSNPVPLGRLDTSWGEIAYGAAAGAAEGIIPLLQDYQSRPAVQGPPMPEVAP